MVKWVMKFRMLIEYQQFFEKVIKSENGAIIEIILDIYSISPHKTLNEIKMNT